MTAQRSLLTLAGLLVGGFTVAHAAAADFGISFHYGTYTPSCYGSRYDVSYYPQSYAYYEDYCDPVTYVGYSSPAVIVYDDCYPRTYRSTYTRSRCYSRPARYGYSSTYYPTGRYSHRSASRKIYDYPYRKGPTYRQHYTRSRHSRPVYTSRYGGVRLGSRDSHSRLRSSLRGYRDRHSGSLSPRYRDHRTLGSRKIRR